MAKQRIDRATRAAIADRERKAAARASLNPLDAPEHAQLGLSAGQVRERILLGLSNAQDLSTSRSLLSILRSNLLTLFNGVVGGAFLLLLLLGQWKDALFGIAVISNVLIGIIQEFNSKRALDKLALLHQPNARVRRDGELVQVASDDIVLDDLLELRGGDQILADGIVVSAAGLDVDESLLTGESEPVLKLAGDRVMAGSIVLSGSGSVAVDRIGAETYANEVTLEARRFSMVNSQLRRDLARVVKWISWALIPIMAIAVNGQMQSVGGWGPAIASGRWVEAAVVSIASIISMIPQGLILITSISFAVGAVKLARQQVLLQELPAVEGLARVDMICFDKTGTLTEGEIVFDAVHQVSGGGDVGSADWQQALAYFGAHPEANTTAKALAAEFVSNGSLSAVASIAFTSAAKWSAFELTGGAGKRSWVLGAPEMVLDAGSETHRSALDAASALAASGRRTLVLAASAQSLSGEALPANLEPVVLVTLREKVRSDAASTLAYFKAEGVSFRIISGDNPQTVAAVAREAGIEGVDGGFDARNLPDDPAELAAVMQRELVFGRVTPEQKRNMVAALQSLGHTVAMTGDGVNDALALKVADLAIAMGSGAAATKAVSNLILLDGRFDALPGVVAEGRRIIANIERVSRLFLTKTTWAMLLAIFFGITLWT
ncbi:MAG: hypothetical protein RL670_477, partial [Actinomycetota bacterium]